MTAVTWLVEAFGLLGVIGCTIRLTADHVRDEAYHRGYRIGLSDGLRVDQLPKRQPAPKDPSAGRHVKVLPNARSGR